MQRDSMGAVAWGTILILSIAAGACAQVRPVAAAADTLAVLTLNIYHDRDDWPERREAIVAGLRELDPDVVLLQEVLQNPELPNQAETLARELGYHFHFTSVDPPDNPKRYGNAILSRFPIVERNERFLAPRDDFRNAAHARLDVRGVLVDVYATHLHHTPEGAEVRRTQIAGLLDFVGATRGAGPVVLGGDFNAPVDAPELAALRSELRDVYGALHPGAEGDAHTTLNPHYGHTPARIDHIFFADGDGKEIMPLAAEIVLREPNAAGVYPSDHFGLNARFRLRSPES